MASLLNGRLATRLQIYQLVRSVCPVTRPSGHGFRDADIDFVAVCAAQTDGLWATTRASQTFTGRLYLGATLLPVLAEESGGDGENHIRAGVANPASGTVSDVEAYLVANIE